MSRKFFPFNGFDSVPCAQGAYALLIRLDVTLTIDIKVFSGSRLAPGAYFYLGSAFGPGGIAARVRRHLAPGRRPHWHVDRLTAAGTTLAVAAVPGGNECRLAACALGLPGATAPLPGFGSSDCARCPAHLVALPTGGTARALAALAALAAAAPDSSVFAIYSAAGRTVT